MNLVDGAELFLTVPRSILKNDGRTLKAVRLTLTGDLSNAYDVWYRCFDSKKDGLAGRVMARMRGNDTGFIP